MRSVNQNSNRKSIASPNPGSKKLIRKIRHSHPQKERSGKEKRRRWRALINTTHPRARTYLHRSQSHARKSLGDLATMAWRGAVGPARYPTGGCQGARHRRGYLLHRELMTPRLLVTHICVGVCAGAGWMAAKSRFQMWSSAGRGERLWTFACALGFRRVCTRGGGSLRLWRCSTRGQSSFCRFGLEIRRIWGS